MRSGEPTEGGPRRPPYLGCPYPLLDYLLSLPGDQAKTLLRVAQLARATPGVVDGIALDAGEALISLRSGKVWDRVKLDAEGLKADGVVALRRRSLARAERDGWVVLRTAHRTSTGDDTENGTRSGTPATIVRFVKFREILWPGTAETAHPTAHPAAQEPAHRNGTIPPASSPPEPPVPPACLQPRRPARGSETRKVCLGPLGARFVFRCNSGMGLGSLAPLSTSEDAAALEDAIAAHGGVDAAIEHIAATYRSREDFKPRSVKLLLNVLRDVVGPEMRAAGGAP